MYALCMLCAATPAGETSETWRGPFECLENSGNYLREGLTKDSTLWILEQGEGLSARFGRCILPQFSHLA